MTLGKCPEYKCQIYFSINNVKTKTNSSYFLLHFINDNGKFESNRTFTVFHTTAVWLKPGVLSTWLVTLCLSFL